MPADLRTLFDIPKLRGCFPSVKPNAVSVFLARERHFLFETTWRQC